MIFLESGAISLYGRSAVTSGTGDRRGSNRTAWRVRFKLPSKGWRTLIKKRWIDGDKNAQNGQIADRLSQQPILNV